MSYQSVNPNDGKVLKSFEHLSGAQLEQSLATAESCFQTWKHTSYAERATILHKAAKLMHDHVDHFARLATLEMGKRIAEARGEVEFSADILAYYAKNAEAFLAPVKLHPKVGHAHMESSPFGVLFCVEPWNFPYYQLARVAGPHLMAGNTLVVKHAGCVPQCAIAFEKLLTDAGAPKGAYTNLLISHAQSDTVIDDPRIKGVALTGSVAAGRCLHQLADLLRTVGPRHRRPACQGRRADRQRRGRARSCRRRSSPTSSRAIRPSAMSSSGRSSRSSA